MGLPAREAALHRSVLEVLQDWVVRYDLQQRIQYANPAFARARGADCEELVGEPVGRFWSEELQAQHAHAMERLRETGEVQVLEQPEAGSGPRPTWTEWTLSPVFDEQGQLCAVQACGRDASDRKRIEQALSKALSEVETLTRKIEGEARYYREQEGWETPSSRMVGESAAMQSLRERIQMVAPTEATVLVQGETGTGKELVAEAIHRQSQRSQGPLIRLNCAALSPQLVESELFGHERGAFTGASKRRQGRFEIADGGTLFLDEVGELPLETQGKLLRALQEHEFERVGSSTPIRADVRVVAATNRDLEREVRHGRFRSDLYFRLGVFPIRTPPLRERLEDLPLLVGHFLSQAAARLGKPVEGLTEDAMQWMREYSWPGNIRELQNVVERAAIVTQGPLIDVDALVHQPQPVRESAPGAGARSVPPGPANSVPPDREPTRLEELKTFDEMAREHVERVLRACHGVVEGPRGAAKILGIKPSTLRARMAKLGVNKSGRRHG